MSCRLSQPLFFALVSVLIITHPPGGRLASTGSAAPPAAPPTGTARYQIRFQTGNIADAGTDADILLKIRGTGGETEEARFGKLADFEKGNNTLYERTLKDVGTIESISIRRTDSRSAKPGWYCTWVRVKNTATDQAAVWFVIGGWVPITWTSRQPMTPADLLGVTLDERLYINPVRVADGDLDKDHDGLRDALELVLAERFKPVWQTSEHEPAHDVRNVYEPLTIFQVRPASNGPAGLAIRYGFVMAQDEGYVSNWALCGGSDWHDGDAEAIEMMLESPDAGRTWSLVSINLEPENPSAPKPGGQAIPRGPRVEKWNFKPLSVDHVASIEWWEEHPREYRPKIFLSAGKHHIFFDPAYDDEVSPYTSFQCHDLVDRKGRVRLANLTSLKDAYPFGKSDKGDKCDEGHTCYPDNNVGESHNPLVTDFSRFWGQRPDPRGCEHDRKRCFASMNAWSTADFMADGHDEYDTVLKQSDGGASMRSKWIRGQPAPKPRTAYEYEVQVRTGDEENAGTACPVSLQLAGRGEETAWMHFGNDPMFTRESLTKGRKTTLWLGDWARSNKPLANVEIARLRMDCVGARMPENRWHVTSMVVVDQTDPTKRYQVTVPSWILGNGQTMAYPVIQLR